jgi:hypothetical protein
VDGTVPCRGPFHHRDTSSNRSKPSR